MFLQISKNAHKVSENMDKKKPNNYNNGGGFGSLFPSSCNGRLGVTPLQLPRGSTLLIHWGNNTNLSSHEKECLDDLVSQHRLSYTFDGGMQVPFDADYRIIVVKSCQNRNELPCSLKMELSIDMELMETMEISCTDGGQDHHTADNSSTMLLSQFRLALAECRFWGNNIGFQGEGVLKEAEEYFLQERAKARVENASSAPPQEDDFHRWLTLTRLQARSHARGKHGSAAATLNDWQAAVALDGAVVSSTSAN